MNSDIHVHEKERFKSIWFRTKNIKANTGLGWIFAYLLQIMKGLGW